MGAQIFGIEGTGLWRRLSGSCASEDIPCRGQPAQSAVRYRQGKSDAVDAESAARAVLAGGCRTAEVRTGTVEMTVISDRSRHRGQGQDTGHADAQGYVSLLSGCLREQFDQMSGKMTLLRRLAACGQARLLPRWHGPRRACGQSPSAGCCWMPRSSSTTLTWKS